MSHLSSRCSKRLRLSNQIKASFSFLLCAWFRQLLRDPSLRVRNRRQRTLDLVFIVLSLFLQLKEQAVANDTRPLSTQVWCFCLSIVSGTKKWEADKKAQKRLNDIHFAAFLTVRIESLEHQVATLEKDLEEIKKQVLFWFRFMLNTKNVSFRETIDRLNRERAQLQSKVKQSAPASTDSSWWNVYRFYLT